MKTFKGLLAVLGVLFFVACAKAEAPNGYKPNINFAQVESTDAPKIKPEFERRTLGYTYVGVQCTFFLGALEDETPYSYAGNYVGIVGKCNYTASGLPDGLSLNTKRGIIYGAPTTVGEYAFTVTATNSHGSADTQCSMTVKEVTYETTKLENTCMITEKESTIFIDFWGDNAYYGKYNYYYGGVEDVLAYSYLDEELKAAVYVFNGSDYPVGYNRFWHGDATHYSGGKTLLVISESDKDGEWDFSTPDTGDTGTTVTVSDETPVMAFAATQEVTTDDEEVVADLEVTAPAVATPTVADVLRGNVTQFNYDLYVMLEIGDGILFITDTGTSKDLTGDTKEFTKKIKSGKHRIFELKMTPVLRLALKGVKIRWYAGCVSDDMEVCGVIATATTEFK